MESGGAVVGGAMPANIIVSRWISAQGGNVEFMATLQTFIVYIALFSAGVIVVDTLKSLNRDCAEPWLD